jgi:hypothetical protein
MSASNAVRATPSGPGRRSRKRSAPSSGHGTRRQHNGATAIPARTERRFGVPPGRRCDATGLDEGVRARCAGRGRTPIESGFVQVPAYGLVTTTWAAGRRGIGRWANVGRTGPEENPMDESTDVPGTELTDDSHAGTSRAPFDQQDAPAGRWPPSGRHNHGADADYPPSLWGCEPRLTPDAPGRPAGRRQGSRMTLRSASLSGSRMPWMWWMRPARRTRVNVPNTRPSRSATIVGSPAGSDSSVIDEPGPR